MKKTVDNYSLERISSRMSKVFGKMKKGEEEKYSFMLLPMESNLLKLHREDPERNGVRAAEAIRMCLLKIDGYVNGEEYDFGRVMNEKNKSLMDGLLMSFDPFTRSQVHEGVSGRYDISTQEGLKKYFETPVKCLIKLEDSISLWTKEMGRDGYFDFIESQFGSIVQDDGVMVYAVEAGAR